LDAEVKTMSAKMGFRHFLSRLEDDAGAGSSAATPVIGRRGGGRRADRAFRPRLEVFEDRLVPTVLDPVAALSAGAVLKVDAIAATSANGHDGFEASYTFTLNPAFAINGDSIQVGLASYLEFGSFPDLTKQEYFTSATGVLDATHTSVTLTVVIDDVHCTQVDAFLGPVVTRFQGFPAQDDLLAGRLLVGRIFDDGVAINPYDSHTACPPDDRGTQGLTIGFWKNHTANWVLYQTTDKVGDVFSAVRTSTDPAIRALANTTLLDALDFKGGPSTADKTALLLKQAVGALLNAAHPEVHYNLTTGQIRAMVNAAVTSLDPGQIQALQAQLEGFNSQEGVTISDPINKHQK
jgi:hypothetical protein